MDYKKILNRLKPKKYWIWRRYFILLWWLIALFLITAIVHWIVWSETTNRIATAVIFWLTFLIMATPIIIIAYIVSIFEERNKKKKEEKQMILYEQRNKELEELKFDIQEKLEAWRMWIDQWLDIFLPEWEFCLMVFWVAVYKTKTQTRSISYSWLRYRIKIAKWLSYTIWNIHPERETIVKEYVDDKWIMYLTNERIIVKLEKKVESIPYEKLLYIELIPWWVIIYKQAWRTLEYRFVWDYDSFPVYMSELLNYKKVKKIKRKDVDIIEVEEEE